jgi:hypothetical protein
VKGWRAEAARWAFTALLAVAAVLSVWAGTR